MGRIDLHALSGARFWVTGALVVHRAILTLWIVDLVSDSHGHGEDEVKGDKVLHFASKFHICAFLHFASKDLVSFYFILSGFSMTQVPPFPTLRISSYVQTVITLVAPGRGSRQMPQLRADSHGSFPDRWGYLSRDVEDTDVRNRYWMRRLARFYPDFFLGTTIAWLLNLPWIFGCSVSQ